MDDDRARQLLERMGCKKIRVSGKELNCSCPFPSNHKFGDRRPSFAAAIRGEEISPYFCFACHEKGTLEGLAVRLGYNDLVPDWKPSIVKASNWIYIPKTNAGVFGHLYKKKNVLFKEEYLLPFVGRLSGYIRRRGITVETAREWELGIDAKNKRAIFPVRDANGRLAMLIGRDVTGKSKIKYSNYVLDRKNKIMVPFIDHSREKDFVSPTKSHFLYGEHKAFSVMQSKNDLIVAEGAIDVLKLWQFGFNAVGVLGSYPSEIQSKKIMNLLPSNGRLVIMADGDEAGRKLTLILGEMLKDRIPVFDAVLSDGLDPGSATKDQIENAIEKSEMIGLT